MPDHPMDPELDDYYERLGELVETRSHEPELTVAQKEANLIAVVRIALKEIQGAPYQARRRGAMYIATILGHRMGPEQLREQEWGTVGECPNCGQIAKAPRVGDSIEGRATSTFCPASRASLHG